ncbi:MAG: DUF5666 domain-containing protein [Anaerolineae bacterium]
MSKRTWFLTLLVVALLMVSSVPAFAAGEERGRPVWRPFTLQGELRGLAESAILVHVLRGDAPVRPYIGQALLVKVNEATRYYRVTEGGLEEIQFADLAGCLGYPVVVSGRMKTEGGQDEFLAQRVLVQRPRPIPFTAQGKITLINADTSSFKMKVQRGTGPARPQVSAEVEIFTTADTEFYRRDPEAGLVPITFGDLRVDDLVQVTGTFLGGRFAACRVVVLPPRPVPFTLFGQITEIKGEDLAFTVKVRRGTGAARDLGGQEVVIVTNETTRFFACEAGDCQEIGFDDLAVGDWVNVVGKALEGTFTARVVVRRAPPPDATP